MIIPIRAWEYQLGADMIRSSLRVRQARIGRILGIRFIDDIVSGIAWRVSESVGMRLGGEKLPR